MIKSITIEMNDCGCEKCKHLWLSSGIPEICPCCKSRYWNDGSKGYKKK